MSVQIQPGLRTVVHLAATGPNGEPRPWYDVDVAIADGTGTAAFHPALNDPVGEWTFTATEVIGGAMATAPVLVK